MLIRSILTIAVLGSLVFGAAANAAPLAVPVTGSAPQISSVASR
ncbi:hypothetical protein [Hasllibacter sp. MH4015]|nr:hypothetical protein [Hasllibacter sp. MH4015]